MASYVTGVAGPIPALHLMGRDYPGWAVILWGIAVGLCGIFAATLLRQKLILVENLPFPTGAATGEIIETMYAGRTTRCDARGFSSSPWWSPVPITWLREARPQLIPQMTAFSVLAGGAPRRSASGSAGARS